jgi:hypothetical protein
MGELVFVMWAGFESLEEEIQVVRPLTLPLEDITGCAHGRRGM